MSSRLPLLISSVIFSLLLFLTSALRSFPIMKRAKFEDNVSSVDKPPQTSAEHQEESSHGGLADSNGAAREGRAAAVAATSAEAGEGGSGSASVAEADSLCQRCHKAAPTYASTPCGCYRVCKGCAQKMATGGKCKVCAEFYISFSAITN